MKFILPFSLGFPKLICHSSGICSFHTQIVAVYGYMISIWEPQPLFTLDLRVKCYLSLTFDNWLNLMKWFPAKKKKGLSCQMLQDHTKSTHPAFEPYKMSGGVACCSKTFLCIFITTLSSIWSQKLKLAVLGRYRGQTLICWLFFLKNNDNYSGHPKLKILLSDSDLDNFWIICC